MDPLITLGLICMGLAALGFIASVVLGIRYWWIWHRPHSLTMVSLRGRTSRT